MAPKKDTETPAFDVSSLAEMVTESETAIQREVTRNKYANNPFLAHVRRSFDESKPMQIPVPGHAVKEVVGYLRAAAKEDGRGLRLNVPLNHPTDATPVTVRFQAKEGRQNGGTTECPVCGNPVSVTSDNKVRIHGARDNRCSGSGKNVE